MKCTSPTRCYRLGSCRCSPTVMGSDVSTDKGNDEKDSPPLEKSDGMMELKVVLKKKGKTIESFDARGEYLLNDKIISTARSMFDYYNEKLKDWKQPTYKFKPKWFVAVRDLSDAKAAESSSSDGTGRKMKRVDLSNKHLVYDVYGNLKLTLKDINAQQVRQLIVIPEPIREWRMPDKTVLKYTPYSKTYNPPREKKALTSDSEFINSEADEDWDEDWDEEYYNGEYDDEHDPSGRGFNASAVDFRDDQSITSDTSSILTPSETSGTDTETASTHSFSSSSVSSSSLTSDSERSDSGDDSSSSVVISRLSESSQLSDSSAAEDSDEQESI